MIKWNRTVDTLPDIEGVYLVYSKVNNHYEKVFTCSFSFARGWLVSNENKYFERGISHWQPEPKYPNSKNTRIKKEVAKLPENKPQFTTYCQRCISQTEHKPFGYDRRNGNEVKRYKCLSCGSIHILFCDKSDNVHHVKQLIDLSKSFDEIVALTGLPKDKLNLIVGSIPLPAKKVSTKERNQEIRLARQSGVSKEELASKYGLAISWINKLCKGLSVIANTPQKEKPVIHNKLVDLNGHAYRLRKLGYSDLYISKQLGISSSVVNILVYKEKARIEARNKQVGV